MMLSQLIYTIVGWIVFLFCGYMFFKTINIIREKTQFKDFIAQINASSSLKYWGVLKSPGLILEEA